MKADSRVIADLISSCSALATMVEQFRVDRLQLKAVDCDWLASKYGKWYECAEHFLGKFIKRTIMFGGQPAYSAGKLQSSTDVKTLLQRNLAFAQQTFEAFCGYRSKAYEIRADYTPDDYEHCIQFLEKLITKHEIQVELINGLGQPGYIAARLEDA